VKKSPEKNVKVTDNKSVRIDKFLWSVRIYKTRSIASEECKRGKILINNIQVKPSRVVVKNEIVIVKKPPVSFTYRIIEPVENRVSAKLVEQFVEDLTSGEEKAKLIIRQPAAAGYRNRGAGRPTKKERRLIDRLTEEFNDNHDGSIKT
jgi:ribosome-associated heat shock protein Hsp15